VVERLEAAGLPFIAPEPVSLEDVYRDILEIGGRLGVPDRAEELVRTMREELRPPTPPPESRPTLLVQWWPKPSIVPGRLSWTTDVITRAGGENPLGSEEVKSRPVSDEEVREIDPDAIVISWCGVDPSKYRPDVILDKPLWAETKAVRNGHVFCVAEAWMGRPGPRLVDGARALREVVATVSRAAGPAWDPPARP
jgi:iron complex transport system substrate-binding protein